MRIVAISDTHDNHRQIEIPPCDILIVAGDFTCHREPIREKYEDFREWLKEQPAKWKVVVAGNHDTLLEQIDGAEFFNGNGIWYLQDETLNIYIAPEDRKDGKAFLRIYGSPWTPEFAGWAFMKPDEELKEYWDKIPEDTDILITHGPPLGFLDENSSGYFCGSKSLWDTLQVKKPKYHIFGHIHESFGEYKSKNILFLNVAQTNVLNEIINDPVVIDL